MNFQTAQAIRTSKVNVGTPGREAMPVILTMQTNYYGDKHWFEVKHDGTILGRFVDDAASAIAKYEAMKRAARTMLEIQRGVA